MFGFGLWLLLHAPHAANAIARKRAEQMNTVTKAKSGPPGGVRQSGGNETGVKKSSRPARD
jgi:hypothetical protein